MVKKRKAEPFFFYGVNIVELAVLCLDFLADGGTINQKNFLVVICYKGECFDYLYPFRAWSIAQTIQKRLEKMFFD
jgi:hypothetical protein